MVLPCRGRRTAFFWTSPPPAHTERHAPSRRARMQKCSSQVENWLRKSAASRCRCKKLRRNSSAGRRKWENGGRSPVFAVATAPLGVAGWPGPVASRLHAGAVRWYWREITGKLIAADFYLAGSRFKACRAGAFPLEPCADGPIPNPSLADGAMAAGRGVGTD
jgi:hypothetical protein